MEPFPIYENNLPSFDNLTWLSEVHPQYDFMEGMMWLANSSIAGMFPAYRDFKGFQLDREDLLNFEYDLNINTIVWDNASALPFIVVGLIYILAMLIAGITWCCCKFCCCARKSYAKDNEESLHFGAGPPIYEENDGKWSTAKIVCNVLMACWMVLFLFLLISAFAMNSTINNAIDDLPNDIDNPLSDADEYLRITTEQFNATFVTSYNNLTEVVRKIISSGIPINEDVVSKTEVFKLQKELTPIKEALEASSSAILNSIGLLPLISGTFNSSVLNGYLKELHSVNSQMDELKETILKTEDFSSARNYLNKIGASKNWINLRAVFPEVEASLERVGAQLRGHNKKFADAINQIELAEIRDTIADTEIGMETAKPYLYNTMWVVLSILVAILVAIVIGTVLTALGSRNKGCKGPSIFFNSGMLGIFISGFFLMMLCLVLYVLSGVLQIACQGIRELEIVSEPDSSVLPEECKVSDNYVLPLYENIVESCKAGQSAYHTLNLCQVYDINELLDLENEFKNPSSILSLPKKELYEEQSYNHLESTLSTMKNTFQGAGDDIKELLRQSNSFFESTKGTPDIKVVETFKLSFEKQAESLKKKISTVEMNLVELGNIQVSASNRQTDEELLDQVYKQVDFYGEFVYTTTNNTIGECKPMYDALDATIEVFCYKVAFPVAGFWLSLAFLLLLYIPIMVTIETLAKISRKY